MTTEEINRRDTERDALIKEFNTLVEGVKYHFDAIGECPRSRISTMSIRWMRMICKFLHAALVEYTSR